MRSKPTTQVYSNYTAADFEVWSVLWKRQMNHLSGQASQLYLDALADIGFTQTEIPDFDRTNKRLMALTGWQLTVAPELVPDVDFFTLLSQRIFPATCWLRTMEELDYLEEPDMFHDVFGHAPLLTHEPYALFMEAFGKLALKWIDRPEVLRLLSAFYWFTVEFGLLAEEDKLKIFGSGIISSVGETLHVLQDTTLKLPFNIELMMHTGYRTDQVQEQYFVIGSFEELCLALPEMDNHLNQIFATGKVHQLASANK
jgi:phenylalanine-4-hydroxylase